MCVCDIVSQMLHVHLSIARATELSTGEDGPGEDGLREDGAGEDGAGEDGPGDCSGEVPSSTL